MSRNAKINALLLFVVAALAVLPLALGLGDHKEEPFSGADAEAETAITEIEPDYEPWFSPLYEPPSGEIESALFALQAALGAGVLAYYFGLHRGRRQGELRALAQQDTAASTTSVPSSKASTSSRSTENSEDSRGSGSSGSPQGSASASVPSAPERT
ncbi:energy-coupling factor ABC transporter substrate-binding protein [Streptomyces rishiriensis]|uniref:Cobalt transport protein CbiN n=1 Tax=Streptomyces rishiriensis TaxID=68264 RepID=A0ABU0NK82_STRRH|nr:energy-coupling factor ABC transporter substrate-binding protein [Streptomyces rishiriensis]MDQ0579495.1 cobalt/nickel transport protein [Streptomyces rishiriensis]